MVCMFSGHRRLPRDAAQLRRRLDVHIERLSADGAVEFLSGGALGFDLLAAEAVLEARQRHPQLSLTMMLPCRNQADRYSADQKRRYHSILERADKVCWLSEYYYDGCMLMRNRAMAERADLCICYLTSSRGGTAHAVAAAAARDVPIVNLAQETDQ